MLYLHINNTEFEYDINALVREFYPYEEIKLLTGENLSEIRDDQDDESITVNITEADNSYHIEHIGPDGKVLSADATALPEDHSDRKSAVKAKIYEVLHEATGETMPWGTMTGIRPVKVFLNLMEQGLDDDSIKASVRGKYLLSDEKTELSMAVARNEKRLLDKLDYSDGYSLYVGIPFCPSTCLYCSFTSYPIAAWKKRVDEYLDALIEELEYTADIFRDKKLQTMYVGGGTPTSLSDRQLDRLLGAIERCFDTSQLLEGTVECGRPDSIDRRKLEAIKKHPFIDRISINPQTMNDETLKLIGRLHTVEDVEQKFAMAREMGFDNINMDLIAGLPGENLQMMENTLQKIKALKPDNLTVHSLAVKRAARLKLEMDRYKDSLGSDIATELSAANKAARDMGLEPYYLYRQKNMAGNFENVGYAAPGKEGIYNILIMEEKQTIAACGAGSISKRVYTDGHIERAANYKDLTLYLADPGEAIKRKRELFCDREDRSE